MATTTQRSIIFAVATLIFTSAVAPDSAYAQTFANYQLGNGWATFGLVLPQGAARGGVQVGSLPTQTDVKTTWPDGSIRFAIVTANASGGTHAIAGGSPSAGTFSPDWPSASVKFEISGATYHATLPPFNGSNSWLSAGPLVREARVIVAPQGPAGAHPLLQVLFDVRSYAGGGHRVDVTVQNVKDVPEGNRVSYNVAISLNGAAVYSKNAVNHAYLTRWRRTFATSGLRLASVTPDFTPFIAAGAIPKFVNSVINPGYNASGDRFDILTFGDMSADMPAPGGRPEIGFYPYWTAQYVVHKSPGALGYMLKHGDLSGSWSGHIAEADGTSITFLDRYPEYWLDNRSIGRPGGPHTLNGTAHWIENAHMPSLTYVPYLVTGDRYYLDQLKFWANFAMLSTWPADADVRRTGQGILYSNQVRGIAWSLRALGDCVAAMPNDDPDRGYFATRLQANLNWFDNWSRTTDGGPTEAIFLGKFGTDTGAWTPPFKVRVSPWMNGYVAWTLDHLGKMGFGPVAHLRDRILRFHVRMFNDPGYRREYAGPYFLNISSFASPGAPQRFFTMREAFCETFGCPPGANTLTPLAGYYGPEERAMLILALEKGIDGASNALAWLEGHPGVMEDVNARSGFAIGIHDGAALPMPSPTPPASGRRPQAPRNVRIIP